MSPRPLDPVAMVPEWGTLASMWGRRRQERRASGLAVVDGGFFAFSALAATWLAYLLLQNGVRPGWPTLLLVVFWLVFTYLVLPRIHRILTLLYVPGYFIGRTRTSDGLLGDPVNLALLGSEAQVHEALTASGWVRADDLDLSASRRIVVSTLGRRSYPSAPLSPLHLFDRQQDFSYQREVDGSPSRRHHVRFWRCPDGWMLPGGFDVDWVAAATYDRGVGLSLFTLQVTHKIAGDTDVERDFLVGTVTESSPAIEVEVITNFSTGYHSRNGGGDRIETDGHLPVIDLRPVEAVASPEDPPSDSRRRRPAQTTFGAGFALLRGLGYLALGLVLILGPGAAVLADLDLAGSPAVVAVGVLAAALTDVVLGTAVLTGHNWARLALMSTCALSATSAFLATVGRSGTPVSPEHLPTVAVSILVLVALSGHPAREYAAHDRGSSDVRG